MLVYVFAAVAGLGLLIASLVGGHGHSGAGVDLDGDGVPDTVGGAHDSVAGLFSLRSLTYMLGFGGLTGLLARSFAGVGEPWAAISALLTGVIAAMLGQFLLRKLTRETAAEVSSTQSLVGRSAVLLLPPTAESAGKVRVQVGGRTLDLLAVSEDAELRVRDEVLILSATDDTVTVTRSPLRTDVRAEPRVNTNETHDAGDAIASSSLPHASEARTAHGARRP